jgi:hypothetical protein
MVKFDHDALFKDIKNTVTEMESTRRNTLVHDRFQVGCSFCGLLAAFPTKHEAFNYGKRVKEKHNQPNEMIETFDTMAHKGKENLFKV